MDNDYSCSDHVQIWVMTLFIQSVVVSDIFYLSPFGHQFCPTAGNVEILVKPGHAKVHQEKTCSSISPCMVLL